MEFFYCYGYGRLSREDYQRTGVRDESNSIKNQRDLIHKFVSDRPDLQLVMEGYDDGYTGTNFDRPHFQEMIEAIKAKKINCVIVKDLSRFGRESIEGGRYMEKMFPAMGVRLISIVENIDTLHTDAATSFIIPVKNLINDTYCRDTSIKVRSHFDVKRRNGEFIGSWAAYGYRKDPENKNHLVVDEEAAGHVRDIFAWRIAGQSCQSIADRLNSLGVLSPMEYKRACGIKYGSGYQVHAKPLWSAVAVRRILQNAVYLGIMEQGKRTTPNYKVKTVIHRPPEEWMRVEGTHEAIISRTDYELVQRLMLTDTRCAPGESTVYPLAGLLCCGDCLSTMARRTSRGEGKNAKRYIYYACIANRDNKDVCSSHSISEAKLEAAVLAGINVHVASVMQVREALAAIARRPLQKITAERLDRRLNTLRAELAKSMEVRDSLYRRCALGELSAEDFEAFKRIFTADCEQAERAIETQQRELEQMLSCSDPDSPWITHFQQYGNFETLDRTTAVRLIDRILVYEGGRIEIVFRYQDEYLAAMKYLALHQESDSYREAV